MSWRTGNRVGLVSCLCLLPIAMGCSSGFFGSQDTQNHRATEEPVSKPATTPAPEGAVASSAGGARSQSEEKANLEAVMAFLERTDTYSIADDRPAVQQFSGGASETSKAKGRAPIESASPANTMASTVAGRADLNRPQNDAVVANRQVKLVSPAAPPVRQALPVVQKVSIRSEIRSMAEDVEEILPAGSNMPMAVGQDSGPEPTLERIVESLKSEVGETSDFDAQWQLSLLQFAMGDDAEARTISPNLSPDARRVLEAFVDAGVAARRVARNPFMTDDEALEAVERLEDTVADLAEPRVSAIALCSRVDAFGRYEETPTVEFIAGRTLRTIIYCEIDNFSSQKTGDGDWETLLATHAELLSSDSGQVVWEYSQADIRDLCRGRRSDFFLAPLVEFPPTLPAGQYVLKVYIEDKLSNQHGEGTLPITVHSAASLAGMP